MGRIKLQVSVQDLAGFFLGTMSWREDVRFRLFHRHQDDLFPQLRREGAKVELLLGREDLASDLERDGGRVALDSIADTDAYRQY